MKKTAKILLIFVLTVTVLFISTLLNCRNLSKQFKDEEISIYIPSGIADDYTDAMKMSFDDGRMWHYRLKGKQAASIAGELENGIWQQVNRNDDFSFFFRAFEHPPGLTDTTYYCIYDVALNDFCSFSQESALGIHHLLFLYDSGSNDYFCFSVSA